MAKLGAREHGMLGLLLQLEYIPIVTFVIPKNPEQGPFADKTVVRDRFGLKARVRAGPCLFCQESRASAGRFLG